MSAPDAGKAFRRIARRYFRTALFYLGAGVLTGSLMLWFGNDNFQFLHGHMLLVGTLLFAAYGGGFSWIAARAPFDPGSGVSPSLAAVQFWLASIGLPGMLLASVLPVGVGVDRIGVLFGFMEAAAGILFGVLMHRGMRSWE